jgi:hypothetical protein
MRPTLIVLAAVALLSPVAILAGTVIPVPLPTCPPSCVEVLFNQGTMVYLPTNLEPATPRYIHTKTSGQRVVLFVAATDHRMRAYAITTPNEKSAIAATQKLNEVPVGSTIFSVTAAGGLVEIEFTTPKGARTTVHVPDASRSIEVFTEQPWP